jgi:hypothetical protein
VTFRFPHRYWSLLPVVKLAATAGLVAGIWIPLLALITSAALVAYFAVAIGMHLRTRDLGRNLFVNATGMLAICIAVPALSLRGCGPPMTRSRWRELGPNGQRSW